MNKEKTKQISNIDFLRGIAAISVLVWHYQHFYFGSLVSKNIGDERYIQPFFNLCGILYTHGYLAVQFFWILSGFVLFYVYKARPDISARTFFAHRFSRLYPLHIITLFLVAILQGFCLSKTGAYQIYPLNDLKHFFLNLVFASHWGLQDGPSFNAPIWSVSVEVLIYIVFFVILKSLRLSVSCCIFWAVISHVLRRYSASSIFECSELFAIGGFLNLFYEKIETLRYKWLTISIPFLLFFVFWVILATGWLGAVKAVTFLGFPSIILIAVTVENRWYSLGKIGDTFGSLTYSSYLIHVPIQLLAILAMETFLGGRDVISTKIFFVGYLTFVLLAAFFVYRQIELPLKNKILALFEK